MLTMSMICGKCGKHCQSLHGGSGSSMVCEECAWGSSYTFIKKTQETKNIPLWKRKLLSFLFPFSGCGCQYCGINYRFGQHSTDYNGKGASGCHLLCNWCWRELPLEKKLAIYREHNEESKKDMLGNSLSVVGHCQYNGWTEKDFEEEWACMKNAVIFEHYILPFENAA